MAIIEDAYIQVKYNRNYEWLNSGAPRPGADGPSGGDDDQGGPGAPPPPN